MGAEMVDLVPGANRELPAGVVTLALTGPFDLSALVTGPGETVTGDGDMVFYNQLAAPGVRLDVRGGRQTVELDLCRLRPGARRVVLVASPADGVTPFGRLPVPALLVGAREGDPIVTVRPTRLSTETALVLAEVYRHRERWKIRAVGQGYADGLGGLVRDYGVQVDGGAPTGPAPVPAAARAGRPGAPAARPPMPRPPTSRGPAPVRPAPVGPTAGGMPTPRAERPAGEDPLLAEVVARTNAERSRVGLVPLTVSPRLAEAARRHSADMIARGFFAHDTPDGVTVADRVTAAGYAYSVVAENIAAGQRTAAEVVDGWMNSPGHRANILRPEVREIGVGRVDGGEYGVYWTQVFGTKRNW